MNTALSNARTEQPTDELFDRQPRLGCGTVQSSEPSLRALIYRYYALHFGFDKAQELTQIYIDALIKD